MTDDRIARLDELLAFLKPGAATYTMDAADAVDVRSALLHLRQLEKAKLALTLNACISCSSPDTFSGGPVSVDGATAWQQCICAGCGASWIDSYLLESQTLEDE